MSSSAIPSTPGGTVRPSFVARLNLITSPQSWWVANLAGRRFSSQQALSDRSKPMSNLFRGHLEWAEADHPAIAVLPVAIRKRSIDGLLFAPAVKPETGTPAVAYGDGIPAAFGVAQLLCNIISFIRNQGK